MKQSAELLWYKNPASVWEEALPLGNGRIGAMVFSGVKKEKISLNEDTLWSGYPRKTMSSGTYSDYEEVQRLVLAERLQEAQSVVREKLSGEFTQSYMPLGDILIDFPRIDDSPIESYIRQLDIKNAISELSFSQNNITYRREAFVSHPKQAFFLKLFSDQKGAITFSVTLKSMLRHTVSLQNQYLSLDGLCPSNVVPSYVSSEEPIIYEEENNKKGMRFRALLSVCVKGGSRRVEKDRIIVENADEAVLCLCTRTSFNGYDKHPFTEGKDYEKEVFSDLEKIDLLDYENIKEQHRKDYRRYYDRMELFLGKGKEHLPTDERLRQKNKESDPSLFSLLFQFGRYLIISASRPGTQATNLQGIWNPHIRPPWSSNYTININTQMNYWPVEACHLSEFHAPLFDLLKTLQKTGKEVAKAQYNAHGFVSHHNTDIWGLSNMVGKKEKGSPVWAFWQMSAGWLAQHTFTHYEYTKDITFLKNTAYPIMKDVCAFYLDLLTKNTKGQWMLSPSTSPENVFIHNNVHSAIAETTTMTMAIIRECFSNYLKISEILCVEDARIQKIKEVLSCLYTYPIGEKGQLLEWDREYEEAEPTHRHSSHLYPLYPGNEINLCTTPELAAACKKTLELRGDEGTGWALAWRVNLWARLQDGAHAFRLLENQLRLVETSGSDVRHEGGSYANLFGAHPPFQIDSNYGASAGIAELFLQNREEEILLLPALPHTFPTGHIKNIKAKNDVTVSIYFEKGHLLKAVLTPGEKTSLPLFVSYEGKTYIWRKKEEITLGRGDFSFARIREKG